MSHSFASKCYAEDITEYHVWMLYIKTYSVSRLNVVLTEFFRICCQSKLHKTNLAQIPCKQTIMNYRAICIPISHSLISQIRQLYSHAVCHLCQRFTTKILAQQPDKVFILTSDSGSLPMLLFLQLITCFQVRSLLVTEFSCIFIPEI